MRNKSHRDIKLIDRRTLLKTGLLAPAALALPITALAANLGRDAAIDLLVVDRRYPDVQGMQSGPAPAHTIDGDVTALWYHTLDPHWRRPGFVVAGYTGPDALFVLERLAWDRGRRVIERRPIAGISVHGLPLTRWVIAPVHPSVGGPL